MRIITVVVGVSLGVTLALAGCGSASVDPGAGTPAAPTVGAGATDDETDTAGADDAAPDEPDLLADTMGTAPFYIDSVTVRVAESHPVQLFLEVSGNAPTPAHTVAYTVDNDGDTIAVHVTTQPGEGMAPQVLQPHDIVIPLGRAELPVTVDVNDGEFTETVNP